MSFSRFGEHITDRRVKVLMDNFCKASVSNAIQLYMKQNLERTLLIQLNCTILPNLRESYFIFPNKTNIYVLSAPDGTIHSVNLNHRQGAYLNRVFIKDYPIKYKKGDQITIKCVETTYDDFDTVIEIIVSFHA